MFDMILSTYESPLTKSLYKFVEYFNCFRSFSSCCRLTRFQLPGLPLHAALTVTANMHYDKVNRSFLRPAFRLARYSEVDRLQVD